MWGSDVLLLLPESSKSAIYFLLAYLEILLDSLDCSKISVNTLWDGFAKVANWKVENFVKYAKYCTAFPMARYLRNELPEKPEGLPSWSVFGGAIYKKIHARLVSLNDKNTSFFTALLQGVKRACNTIPRTYIEKSKLSHLKVLTTAPSDIDEAFMERLEGKFMGVGQKFKLPYKKVIEVTEPSKNACFEWARDEGGQYNQVQKIWGQTTFNERSVDNHALYKSMLESNDLIRMDEGRTQYYYRDVPSDKIDLINIAAETLYKGYPLNCKIVPLAEPLKVRTISAGEGLPYYVGKSYQKAMWSYLKEMPQFVAIGEPLRPDHLHKMMIETGDQLDLYLCELPGRPEKGLPLNPTQFFVSGDYSSATDLLNIKVTLAAFDSFVLTLKRRLEKRFWSEDGGETTTMFKFLDVIRSLLEPHNMFYNDSTGSLEQYCIDNCIEYQIVTIAHVQFLMVHQRNGQLMGSPISFPFLCLINLVVYWVSLEDYLETEVPMNLLPVLVNGDDIAFRSNPEHYAIWKDYTARVGFKLSLGKNYIHPSIMTMNSEVFRYVGCDFRPIKYFNVGLLMAQSKGRLADPTRKLPLVDLYRFSVLGAQDKLRAHRRFLHYNRLQISKITDKGKFNLFIPIHLGGLGFPTFPELFGNFEVTKFQRRFATFLLRRIEQQLALGVYPKKYLFALVSEATPMKSYFKKTGMKALKLGGEVPDEGWEIYSGPNPLTAKPFQADRWDLPDTVGEISYRLPSRSLLREFNTLQYYASKVQEGGYHPGAHCVIATQACSDETLFSTDLRFVWFKPTFPKVELVRQDEDH